MHQLYRHLAACDLAVVQGGLTTTMELTAVGRPFLYFPLANHFEQQLHVAVAGTPAEAAHRGVDAVRAGTMKHHPLILQLIHHLQELIDL